MLKIFKKLKEKTEEELIEYAEKDIRKISEILNRPHEGEIIKIENIKIKDDFKRPNYYKMLERKAYYQKHKYFRAEIVLDNRNFLINGYTTYLLAKEMGFDYITIVREEV